MIARIIEQLGGSQHQNRPQAFAARFDQMSRQFGDARRMPDCMRWRMVWFTASISGATCAVSRENASAMSTSRPAPPRRLQSHLMEELLKTNDPTIISFATALLKAEGIDCFVFDVHMSVLDGSIGILPRRLMVAREDAFMARAILRDNQIELEGR